MKSTFLTATDAALRLKNIGHAMMRHVTGKSNETQYINYNKPDIKDLADVHQKLTVQFSLTYATYSDWAKTTLQIDILRLAMRNAKEADKNLLTDMLAESNTLKKKRAQLENDTMTHINSLLDVATGVLNRDGDCKTMDFLLNDIPYNVKFVTPVSVLPTSLTLLFMDTHSQYTYTVRVTEFMQEHTDNGDVFVNNNTKTLCIPNDVAMVIIAWVKINRPSAPPLHEANDPTREPVTPSHQDQTSD